jgi:hypothetical protein
VGLHLPIYSRPASPQVRYGWSSATFTYGP